MKNIRAVIQFLKQAKNYLEFIKDNEILFYSSEAKEIRSQLVGLLRDVEDDLNSLLGANKLIDINAKNQVNVLTAAVSEDYKSSVYCLDILLDTLKNNFNDSNEELLSEAEILDLLNKGESGTLEFKSSLRWDYKKSTVNKELEFVIAKTISAFMNSKGGKLLIGVKDSGEILGINSDISTLKNQNTDGFLLQLTQVINDYLGKENHQFINVNVVKINGDQICLVDVEKNPNPVYVKNKDGKEEFYIRSSASSQPLSIREANEYIRSHWLR